MTEKPNSVCKHCHHEIERSKCGEQFPWQTTQFDGASVSCPSNLLTQYHEPVAEPAEPEAEEFTMHITPRSVTRVSAEPTAEGPDEAFWKYLDENAETVGRWPGWMRGDCSSTAPQPVAGEGPCPVCHSAPPCQHSKPTTQEIITSAWKTREGTPKLEEVIDAIMRLGFSHDPAWHRANVGQALRPFITPTCSPPNDSEILQVIDERDHWEEVIGDLAVLAGCEEEWSNLHEHGDCIAEEIHRLRAGSNYVANDEIYPTEVTFSNGRAVRIRNEGERVFLEISAPDQPFVVELATPACSLPEVERCTVCERDIPNTCIRVVWQDEQGQQFVRHLNDCSLQAENGERSEK